MTSRRGVFDSCHVSVSSSTVVGDSVLTGGSATALSATPTKEATHLSMITRHDLKKGYSSAATCLCLAAQFRHTPVQTPTESSESATTETRRLYYGRKSESHSCQCRRHFPGGGLDVRSIYNARTRESLKAHALMK